MMKSNLKPLQIEFKSNEGYGDFITGLCYAHGATVKFQRPVHLVLHWPNPKNHLLSEIDQETIFYRFEYIHNLLKPAQGLTIEHRFESVPAYRFVNNFYEFEPLHGLWYLNKPQETQYGLVALWSSRHNLEFPGYNKDPLYDEWDSITNNLEAEGYQVVELTYRTPVAEVMDVISKCEFGIGYEGMVHQIFKFVWKPLVVASKRVSLAQLLCPQGKVISHPRDIQYTHIQHHILESKRKIRRLKKKHSSWLTEYEDPSLKPMYNKEDFGGRESALNAC